MIPVLMEGIAVMAIGAAFTVANGLHVLIPWLTHPRGTVFTGIAHYYGDYFFYISHIAEGMAGHITVAGSRFTNEPMGRSGIYWFNALLGLLGRYVSPSPFFLYNAALFVCVVGLVAMWYLVVRTAFPKSRVLRIVGLLLILSATSLIDMGKWLTTGAIDTYGYFWFSPAPAFNRLGGVPHQVFQTIIMLTEVWLTARALEPERRGRMSLPFIGLFTAVSAVATLSNPTQMFLIVVCTFVYSAGSVLLPGWSWRTPRRLWENIRAAIADPKATTAAFTPAILMAAAAFPVALGVLSTFNLPTYVAAKQWELSQRTAIPVREFILAMGPIALFVPFGIIPMARSRSVLAKLLMLYAGLSLVFFFTDLPDLFQTARPRFLHPASYGTFPILAAFGMAVICQVASGIFRGSRAVWIGTLGVLILGYGFLTAPGLYQQINARIDPVHNPIIASPLEYVSSDVAAAMAALARLPAGDRPVVVTDPLLPYDVLVPAATSDKVSFTGHPIHTLYGSTKEAIRQRIFSGIMTENELKSVIHNHRIGYFLVSSSYGRPGLLSRYPFVKTAYANDTVTLFAADDTLRQ